MEGSGIRTNNYGSGSWGQKTYGSGRVFDRRNIRYRYKGYLLFFKSVIVVNVILIVINAVRYTGNFLIFIVTSKPLFNLSISSD
jgi:hypothetical protein